MTDEEPIKVRYKNPWASLSDKNSGKGYFEYNESMYGPPKEYKGYLIYHRIRSTSKGGDCYDVVKAGVCLTQLAGPNGARKAIDNKSWEKMDWWN